MLAVLITIIKVLGSVGLFLYSMRLLSSSLQKTAGGGLEKALSAMTRNRFSGVLTGLVTTAVVQSSSATTVMVVGFVNAGFFTLRQAISVIMGANIGTTTTAWIVSTIGFNFDITILAFVLLFASAVLQFGKSTRAREISNILVGLSLVFISLYFLKESVPDTTDIKNTGFLSFLSKIDNGKIGSIFLCILAGSVMTMIIQSSAAAMTLTITAASMGWIGVYSATALCLGQNIGTTITAVIASAQGDANAKRAALAHVLFNIIGSVIAVIFLRPLLLFVNMITISDIFTVSGKELSKELPIFLSMFHTVFNLANTILFLPFVNQLATLIEKIIPPSKDKSDKRYKFSFKYSLPFLSMPDVYLSVVKDEIIKLSGTVLEMLDDLSQVLSSQDEDCSGAMERIEKNETKADEMQEELTAFCVKLISKKVSSYHTSVLTSFIRIIDELESITDSCYALSMDAQKRYENKLFFDDTSQRQILDYLAKVQDFMNFIDQNIKTGPLPGTIKSAFDFENSLNVGRAELVAVVEKRMENTQNIKTELIEFDMVRHMEHIGDYCTNIAQSINSIRKKA